MRKCPPGVICFESYAYFSLLIITLVLGYLFWQAAAAKRGGGVRNQITIDNSGQNATSGAAVAGAGWSTWWPSWPYTNADPLLNPYNPPLRDERYFVGTRAMVPLGVTPINVSTNIGAVDASYRQVGMLTATNTKERILPLMGRPLFVNRDKWQYYSISDQNNSIKLPVSRSGRSCTNEYGCTQLYTGDTVFVDGINEAFRVTLYDNDTIRYLPFL